MDKDPKAAADHIARLEDENRELRNRIERLAEVPESPTPITATRPAANFRGCALSTVVVVMTLSAVSLTLLFPPWQRVRSQRHQLLYWSQWVKDYERQFVGFGFLLSSDNRKAEWPMSPYSGMYFDVTEYRIFWPLLVGEWVVLIGLIVVGARAYKRQPQQPPTAGR